MIEPETSGDYLISLRVGAHCDSASLRLHLRPADRVASATVGLNLAFATGACSRFSLSAAGSALPDLRNQRVLVRKRARVVFREYQFAVDRDVEYAAPFRDERRHTIKGFFQLGSQTDCLRFIVSLGAISDGNFHGQSHLRIAVSRLVFFLLDTFENLFAMYGDILRRVDANSDLISFHAQNSDGDFITNHEGFPHSASQN